MDIFVVLDLIIFGDSYINMSKDFKYDSNQRDAKDRIEPAEPIQLKPECFVKKENFNKSN